MATHKLNKIGYMDIDAKTNWSVFFALALHWWFNEIMHLNKKSSGNWRNVSMISNFTASSL